MSIELCPHCGKHYDQDYRSEDHEVDENGWSPCSEPDPLPVISVIKLAEKIHKNSIDDWAGPTKEWEKCLEEAIEIIANQKDE